MGQTIVVEAFRPLHQTSRPISALEMPMFVNQMYNKMLLSTRTKQIFKHIVLYAIKLPIQFVLMTQIVVFQVPHVLELTLRLMQLLLTSMLLTHAKTVSTVKEQLIKMG
jgi:hypothetical protein